MPLFMIIGHDVANSSELRHEKNSSEFFEKSTDVLRVRHRKFFSGKKIFNRNPPKKHLIRKHPVIFSPSPLEKNAMYVQ